MQTALMQTRGFLAARGRVLFWSMQNARSGVSIGHCRGCHRAWCRIRDCSGSAQTRFHALPGGRVGQDIRSRMVCTVSGILSTPRQVRGGHRPYAKQKTHLLFLQGFDKQEYRSILRIGFNLYGIVKQGIISDFHPFVVNNSPYRIIGRRQVAGLVERGAAYGSCVF